MTRRSLSMLIVLNAVLLAALSVSVFSPPAATAQGFSSSTYTMIAGTPTGRSAQDVVYIIDLNTSKMAAVIFNTSNGEFTVLDGRVVAEDSAKAMGPGK